MSQQQLQHLIRMANQIAANLQAGRDAETAARGVANHLRRFWTVAMCQQLIDAPGDAVEQLGSSVVRALELLRDEATA